MWQYWGAKHVGLAKRCAIIACAVIPWSFVYRDRSCLIMWQGLVKRIRLPSAGVELQPLATIDSLKTEALNWQNIECLKKDGKLSTA